MNSVVWALIGLLATIAGYFALVAIGRRLFSGRFRAEAAAAAVVVAFIVGSEWPYAAMRTGSAEPDPAVKAVAARPALPGEIGRLCTRARFVPGRGTGNLDRAGTPQGKTVAGGVAAFRLRVADELIVDGWASEPSLPRPAQGACLVLDGVIFQDVRVSYGGTRADVAAAYGKPELLRSGFEIVVPARRITVGSHRVQVAAVSADGTALLVNGSATILVGH